MIYAKVNTETKEILEYPVDVRDVKHWLDKNNISITSDFASYDLTSFGWYVVEYLQPPESTIPNHKVVLDEPRWEGNSLIRTFKEVPRTIEEIQSFWVDVRAQRDKLLEDSDWTELPSVKKQKTIEWQQAWYDYRLKLRNITMIEDPTKVDWPLPPEN